MAAVGTRIILNIAGRGLGLSDRLGDDLIGRYGLLTPAGLDDTAGAGALGDALFNPGETAGVGSGSAVSASAGVASGIFK